MLASTLQSHATRMPCSAAHSSGACSYRPAAPIRLHQRAQPDSACRATPSVFGGKVYIDPVEQSAAAFAPATVANLGPGFDWMGCAVEVRDRPAATPRQLCCGT